jgi:exopolyphosphatase/guanosine-5'-triphosphate,3'-diphosphate pyrophosphatase
MPIAAQARMVDEPRIIEIDTKRVLGRKQSHFGVIDIGSNSIRLVVYDDLSRAPFPRFNEKSLCALGAGIDNEGNFSTEAMAKALRAIRRFSVIAKAMEVERVDVIATEATRRAKNGTEFIAAIERETGLRTRLLTGAEEAHYTAQGVISGFYQPNGLVGDIGGGSLEVAEILGDRVGDRNASMPIGALPVKAIMESSSDGAKKHIDKILSENLPPLLTEPVFYAVGGGWRAIARVHIAMNNMPVSAVHGYDLPAGDIRSLAKKIARMSRDEVAALPDVPSRRIDTLPAAALVMSRVLKNLKPERVVFSAYGLREGWLFAQLDEEEQYRDPLLEGAQAIGLPIARVPEFCTALSRWTDELFPGENQSGRRLRLTACALTDMAWRDHPKVRAAESFMRLLQFPFIGISHSERVFLAIAIMARYGGKFDGAADPALSALLSPSEVRHAEILGRALLLGHRFSASVPEILEKGRLRIDADAVRLEVLDRESVPDSDAVQSRLKQLAKAANVDGAEIVEPED